MLFHFRLAAVEDHPWWTKNPPTLDWYFLTDGWYWMEVGGQELFRYTAAIQEHWAQLYAEQPSPLPYENYMVSRYWEDLLEMLPAILDPLPADLAEKIARPEAWQEWQDRAWHWKGSAEVQEAADLCYVAMRWWGQRTWSAWHLRHPPNLWLWTVGDTVHIRWDNRVIKPDGLPVWEASVGEVTLPASDFLNEVRSFNTRFLSAMEARVTAAGEAWPSPEMQNDVAALVDQQRERSTWLEKALVKSAREYGWEEVRGAMARIEQESATR